MNDLGLSMHMRGSQGERFEDNKALYNHLNELFRTDSGKRFTNEWTPQNVALFPMEHGLGAVRFDSVDQQRRARDMAGQLLIAYTGGKIDLLEADITYIELFDDESERPVTNREEVLALDENFFKQVSGFVLPNKPDLADYLFHVLHDDQEEMGLHIHSIKLV